MADLGPAIVGGGIGVVGTLSGTLLTLRYTHQRDARATALATAEKIASVEQHVWSQVATDGPSLLSLLRQLDVRLRDRRIPLGIRSAFAAVCYSFWQEANAVTNGEAGPQVSQGLLNLRNKIESVLLAEVLSEGSRWRRWKNRRSLLRELQSKNLAPPPTAITP